MGPSPSLPATLFSLLLLCSILTLSEAQTHQQHSPYRSRNLKRSMEEDGAEEDGSTLLPPPKKKTTNTTITIDTKKNQTKLLKPKKTNSTTTITLTSLPKSNKTATFNATSTTTKLPKSSNSTTKLLKSSDSTTKLLKPSNLTSPTTKPKPKSSNSTTTKPKPKSSNSTTTPLKPKIPDLPTSHKNKTSQPPPTKNSKKQQITKPVPIMPWLEDDDDDLISEFRELPSRFHDAVVPDLRKISTTSKAYLTLANKEFTRSFKPLVGTKYAPPLASFAFTVLLLLPLVLVAALFRHLRGAHLPLQKVLLSVQIYLAVYFLVLALAAALTGLEPLRFLHASSPGSYVYTQVLQTLGYVLYLLLQLMNVVVAGSTALAMAQLALGLAVGLHYYTAVFHRAVLGEPPKTNWKIHAIYAACFVLICAFARAERRKKEYVHGGGGEDGKKS